MARIGTSGWSYDHWAGVLYRPGLPARDRLARYVEEFDTVVRGRGNMITYEPPAAEVQLLAYDRDHVRRALEEIVSRADY